MRRSWICHGLTWVFNDIQGIGELWQAFRDDSIFLIRQFPSWNGIFFLH